MVDMPLRWLQSTDHFQKIISSFPAEGKNGKTTAKTTAGSESLWFIGALGTGKLEIHSIFLLALTSILLSLTILIFSLF
jgi:hypothetical protein